MKTIFPILLTGALMLGSCSERFLELAPQTNLSATTFFQTEEQFDQALVAAYSSLRGIVVPGFYMDEMRSDNAFFTYYAPDRGPANWVEDIVLFRDNPQTTVTNNRYRSNYVGISRVNAILARIDKAGIPAAAKNRVRGEALFLRAFFYYDLVLHYGGVPLHLNDVASVDQGFLPKAGVGEVYNQVMTDVEAAIPLLQEVSAFPQTGRATRGAAKLLLAYTCMSKPDKEYTKAETALLDVTKMSYRLLANYVDVFKPENKNSSESIFEIQYQEGTTGQQSDFIYTFLPKTANTVLVTGLNASSLSRGGWNVPTQEMVDSYEKNDARLPASIGVIEGTQQGDNFTYETLNNVTGFKPSPGKTHYYFVRKYLNPPYKLEFNTNDNWPVFRYAGALLLLAECLAVQGKTGEALPYVNEVRKRSGLTPLATVSMEQIANEMRHELAFENHRYTDLIRTGKAIETLTRKGNAMLARYPWIPENSFQVTEDRLVYPIPFRELQINHLLEQNKGYN